MLSTAARSRSRPVRPRVESPARLPGRPSAFAARRPVDREAHGQLRRSFLHRRIDLRGASGDVFKVNLKTLGRLLSVSWMCAALAGYAKSHDNVGDVVSMGDNTYSIKVEAKNALHRDVDELKAEANQAAADYCSAQGKVFKEVSLSGKVPTFGLGYAYAKIVFKALNPGDPELTAQAPVAGAAAPVAGMVAAPVAVGPPPERHLDTDELYNELVKLDDLRKKGILTDEEFQAEKKKLLNHSN